MAIFPVHNPYTMRAQHVCTISLTIWNGALGPRGSRGGAALDLDSFGTVQYRDADGAAVNG